MFLYAGITHTTIAIRNGMMCTKWNSIVGRDIEISAENALARIYECI